MAADSTVSTIPGARLVRVSDIDASPKPWHARGEPEEADVNAFAAALQAGATIQHPLKVRPHPRMVRPYELVTGVIRYRGARRAGVSTVPVIVEDLDDQSAALDSLGENLGRRGIPYLRIGWAALPLVEQGMRQKVLADRIGCVAPTISEALKLARAIPQERAEKIASRNDTAVDVIANLKRDRLRKLEKLPSWEARERELELICAADVDGTPVKELAAEAAQVMVRRRGPSLSVRVSDLRQVGWVGLLRLFARIVVEAQRARQS